MFDGASAFNRDVSKWNTGAVTTMAYSISVLFSPSLWPRLPLLCLLNIRQLEFHRLTLLTRFVLFVLVCLKRYSLFVVCGGLVFLFLCCALSLVVFYYASAFNQDVSKWNTGAVINMKYSKCTLSPSLSGHTPSAVVYFEYTTTRVPSDHTLLTLFIIFVLCVL